MEQKKNPKKDLNKNSGLYFITGLVLVMLLAYVALEWKTYDKQEYIDVGMNNPDGIDEEIPPMLLFKTPPPPPVAPPIIEVVDDKDDTIETEILPTEPNHEEPVIKVEDIDVIDEPIDEEVTFYKIEDVPVFPGCEKATDKRACFQKMMSKHVRKNFRYPEIAQEMGIQGKVYVQFVIQKDGSISNVRMRGPDKILEKEAARIIDKLPEMKPGMQRKVPVRVPFNLPITFKLQQ